MKKDKEIDELERDFYNEAVIDIIISFNEQFNESELTYFPMWIRMFNVSFSFSEIKVVNE